VVGAESLDGVEVGLVKVFNHEYCQSNAMDLTMLRDDGTFSMRPSHSDDRPRTLCVRAPGHPWTYLRHDFPPGASGKDIVLHLEPGKKILVHAQLQGGPAKTWMMVEAFDGYQRRDDHQAPVHSEYYGGHQSDEGSAYIMLPLRPMALRVRADNSASGCVIVDPREVDEVTIRLPKEGRLNVHVVSGSRELPQKTVWLFNPCQRLSWMGIETGTDARFDLEGLMPGQYRCFVDDHVFTVSVGEGATTEARFDLSDKSRSPLPLQEALDVSPSQSLQSGICALSDASVAYDR
jgi:hypothetical protein